jgi:uncharacterized NAD(P)/FAD-binding protein YdhS
MTRIAVVGAGFSGTLLALHLLRKCPPSVEVALIEKAVQFGRGAAYATGNPNHLLNVPAGRMSAFHDRPRDFLDWLEVQDLGSGPVTETSFVSRRLFGAYIRHLLNAELKVEGQEDKGRVKRLKLIRGDVGSIAHAGGGLDLNLGKGRSLSADIGVLAVGNFPSEAPPIDDPGFYDSTLYRGDPWASDIFEGLDRQSAVLLIGTGLTMVDTVISLLDRGHNGPIYALSRRGLLPHRHEISQPPRRGLEAVPTDLVALTRFLRKKSADASAEGVGWRPIVDELRPFAHDVWGAMSPADRARFLRHLRPWWEIHRHRMADAIATRIDGALATGQLLIFAGRIKSFREFEGRVAIEYRKRGSDMMKKLIADRVINCSGPGCDYARIAHPLIKSLLSEGAIRPDALNLGLDVTQNCAVKNRRGEISGKLFAVGPVTKGAFWEMTAVPDIRRQCEFLATHLSAFAAGIKPKPTPAAFDEAAIDR